MPSALLGIIFFLHSCEAEHLPRILFHAIYVLGTSHPVGKLPGQMAQMNWIAMSYPYLINPNSTKAKMQV